MTDLLRWLLSLFKTGRHEARSECMCHTFEDCDTHGYYPSDPCWRFVR